MKQKISLLCALLLCSLSVQAEVILGYGIRPGIGSGQKVQQDGKDLLTSAERAHIEYYENRLNRLLDTDTLQLMGQMQPYLTLDGRKSRMNKQTNGGLLSDVSKAVRLDGQAAVQKMRLLNRQIYPLLKTPEQKYRFRVAGMAWAEYMHDDCTLTAEFQSDDYIRCLNLHYEWRAQVLEQTLQRLKAEK